MQTKVFSICLDMRQSLPFHPFEVTEGDTGNVLHVTLQNDGEPLLLNDCTVVVVFASSMGFAMQDASNGVTIGSDAGTFTVLMDPNHYGPGIVSVDVQVYSGPDGKVLVTSTRFDFRCRRSLVSAEIIRANVAYPPLMAAAQSAWEATAAANAAAESILTSLGEENVQANWSETDSASDAFIKNKPLLTPYAIGAAERTHASAHAAGGDDPITPASIGAAVASAATVTLTVAGWTGSEGPYEQTVAASGVLADVNVCHVVVGPALASQEEYGLCTVAPSAQGAGTLTFTCAQKPESALSVQALVVVNGAAQSGVTVDADDQEVTNLEILNLWNS